MFKSVLITAECPYCGHKNQRSVDQVHYSGLFNCDQEEGGCDKDFAVYSSLRVDAHVTSVPLNFDGGVTTK